MDALGQFNLSSLAKDSELYMKHERKDHLLKSVPRFVKPGRKTYPRHSERGTLVFRNVSSNCHTGGNHVLDDTSEELVQLSSSNNSMLLSITFLHKMPKPELVALVLEFK